MSVAATIKEWESRLSTRRALLERARKDHAKATTALERARKADVHPRQHLVDEEKAQEKRHNLRLRQVREAKAKLVALAKKARPRRLKALDEARKQLGVMEHGGNNRGADVERFIREGGGEPGWAWCGYFVAHCYRVAGAKPTWHWAAVRLMASAGSGLVRRSGAPKPGDVVRFTFDHTGLFERDLGNGYIQTIEGNTGATGAVSDSSTGGDGVYRKVRAKSLVADYLRLA